MYVMNNATNMITNWIPTCYQALTHKRPQLLIRQTGIPEIWFTPLLISQIFTLQTRTSIRYRWY